MGQLANFTAGQPLSAGALQALVDEVKRLGKISTRLPLTHTTGPAGITFAYAGLVRFPIKLTSAGAGGKYAWTRQIATAAGGWANDPSGEVGNATTEAAQEMNAVATLSLTPNPVVLAWRDPVSNVLIFQAEKC